MTGAASPDAMLRSENARLKRLLAGQALGPQPYKEVLEGSPREKEAEEEGDEDDRSPHP